MEFLHIGEVNTLIPCTMLLFIQVICVNAVTPNPIAAL